MEPVLTPDAMRRADNEAISAGTPGAELMDRAASACASVALAMMDGGYGRRVLVVCGKGNNGGDGIAVARHLARAGTRADVLLLSEPAGDAEHHLEATERVRGVRVRDWSVEDFAALAARADLVVDAVLGTGTSGPPTGTVREAISSIEACGRPVLSVDIPSGVDGSDGSVPGPAVSADVSVAVQSLKVGHVLTPGALRCGRIDVADIGIPVRTAPAWVPTATDVAAALPELDPDTHKYRVGAVAVLAGSPGMTGAAVLVASGAMRAGAGMVMLGVPRSCLSAVEQSAVEAVKTGLPETDGALGGKAFDEFAPMLDKARALAVGPGLGRSPHAVELVRRALAWDGPLVLDADALWALAEIGPQACRDRTAPTVLTPHTAEFARLTGAEAGPNRLSAALDAAREWGAVVHLKGRRAVTASPDGTAWVNTTGNPGVATAGTGDVLTGIVSALCARGADATTATWAGAWLHGTAGDIAADRAGRSSMTSADLAEAVPAAIRRAGRGPRPTGVVRTVVEAP